MRTSFDLVVIGGGAAGSAAALSASRRGARVALVRAGPGVTGMTTGAWNGPLSDDLARALADAGLAHERCDRPLPHANGDLRACAFAAATHAQAHVDARTLVCGIAGLGGFHAPALARLWGDAAGAAPSSTTLQIDGTPHAGWSPVALAAAIERDPHLLGRPLAAALRGRAVSCAILPAVLGLDDTRTVIAALRASIDATVVEALAAPPSVPGWRLARALDRALRDAGVDVIAARASRTGNGGRSVTAVRVTSGADGAAPRTLDAARFILATGKFAGGGIAASDVFRETTLDCPVWVDALGQRFVAPHALALTHAQRTEAQPILEAGVRTDETGRPLDADGDVVFDNVIVAGSVRAGVAAAELGLGAAAKDGWRAGEYVEAMT